MTVLYKDSSHGDDSRQDVCVCVESW